MLQSDVEKVNDWCKINKMSLNPKKSTSMLLGSLFNTRRNACIQIKIGDQDIECVSQQKLLGIYIDRNLSWNIQTEAVYKKLNSKLALFRRIKPYLNEDMRIAFYNAYILPVFDYACVIWCNSSMKHLNKIINTQKRAARMILDKRYDHPSAPLFKELKWLPFTERCKYHTGMLVFKVLNNLLPEYLNDILLLNQAASYNLRSANSISHPLVKSRYTKNTFQYVAVNVWNNIPVNIRNKTKLASFRHTYRNYLLSTQ